MTLRINTNTAALTAHKNLIKNDNSLSASLEKLSSGLRINKAADDASGMAIADSLKSQGLGLGQAIRNANDAISVVQTADGALEESINIVNTIKTKAIQAAQDGQTTDSRKAIQSDINKLMEELDNIAKTTSFNNQKLLSGNFVNKQFQVGAYSGETVGISIGSTESTKNGHVTVGNLSLTNASGGSVQLSMYSNLQSKSYTLQAVDIKANNTAENGMGALADAINKLSDVLGISADAVVNSTSTNAVAAGSTGSDFAINGVTIGSVAVADNDATGTLVKAINNKSSDHGVVASVGADGKLTLSASDGRAISVTGSTGGVLAGSDMSTFGYVQLKQSGSNELLVTDLSSGDAVAFDTNVTFTADITTTMDSTLAIGSVLGASSELAAGSTIGANLNGGTEITTAIEVKEDSLLKAGSSLGASSVIESGSVLGGDANFTAAVTTTSDSLLKSGSVLGAGTVLKAGTLVTSSITVGTQTIAAGSVLSVDTSVTVAQTLTADMIVKSGSTLGGTSAMAASGSYIGGDITLTDTMGIDTDMVLKGGDSEISTDSGSVLLAGSTIGGDVTLGATVTNTIDGLLKKGSVLTAASSEIADGSSLGATIVTGADLTATRDVTLSAGSVLSSGSILAAGTTLTNDIQADGVTIKAGTTLEQDATLTADATLAYDMTLKKDSSIASGSTLAASEGGLSGTKINDVQTYRLSDVNVLTQEGAQIAITVADSALKDLDSVRSGLGSVQNQLTSTISNLSVTKVNVNSAESSIRDVDFAEESANYSKMSILSQASTFAMAQANSSSQNVLSLLQ